MTEHFPRQFGKYVLLKSLARGGMGEIHLAASGEPGGPAKLCVIKKVITEKTEPAKVNRFLDEAKVVLRLSHSNLVSTFDAGDVNGELFIAMELVEGKDLREIWNRCVRTRARIPVDVALVVIEEIARALAYVHTYGGLDLVHRDVAPPNILLSYGGAVKLTDFGLARSVLKLEHTAPGVVFGRASYLAPEQARGEIADARTDVYSLGIVLWELLTGQSYLQLAGLDPVTSLSLVRNPRTQPPSARAPWILPELDAVVLRALAADREKRFQTAQEMHGALFEVKERVAPRADAERIAQFLRGLYRDTLGEETADRERLLAQARPFFGGDRDSRRTAAIRPEAMVDPTAGENTDPISFGTSPGALSGRSSVGSGVAAAADAAATSAIDTEASRVVETHGESLAAAALRARAGSQVRRMASDLSGAEITTKVWRRGRGPRGEDAAQTFVGRVIDGRYLIKHRIGEGGMGTVYAAEHVDIGKTVAVKILHRLFSGEEQLVERFRREARAASRVGHPHIIEVTDFGTTEEGCAYFVMEYLEGMDLADVLVREGKVDAARTVRIAMQICQALEAAHVAGVIHRDLKPENIFLVTRNGQADFVKVLDFGIARDLSRESRQLTNPGMTMGTPEYMAPEQSMGRPADRRTDVYAVGALLYEMISGIAPFKADSHREMLEAKRRPPESLRKQGSQIPPALDGIILRALGPDPERRPQTMAELEQELARIVWDAEQAVAEVLGGQQPQGSREEPSGVTGRENDLEPRGSDIAGSGASTRGVRQRGKNDKNDKNDKNETKRTGKPGRRRIGSGDSQRKHDGSSPEAQGVAENGESPAAAMDQSARGKQDDARFHGGAESLSAHIQALMAAEPEADLEAGTSLVSIPGRIGAPISLDVAPVSGVETSSHGAGFVGADSPPRVDALDPDLPPAVLVPVLAEGMGRLPVVPDFGDLWAEARPSPIPPARRHRGVVIAAALGVLAASTAAWIMMKGPPPINRDWGGKVGARSPSGPLIRPVGPPSSPPSLPRANGTVVPALVPPARHPETIAMSSDSPVDGADTRGSTGPRPPRPRFDIVQTPPIERARAALAAGIPDDAIAVLRPAVKGVNDPIRLVLADALVASGWKDAKTYRWTVAMRKAREALELTERSGTSHGAHALLGEALYAVGDFGPALTEFMKALSETPRDARLKRRVVRSRRQLRRPGDDKAAAAESAPPQPSGEPASEQ
jgi:serine/threonine protein kinase